MWLAGQTWLLNLGPHPLGTAADQPACTKSAGPKHHELLVLHEIPVCGCPADRSTKSLSFGKFLKSFQPLKDAADNKEVQVYPCKFYVKVWVATTSQESYRRALENVVENVFFTYAVKDEAWPH